MKKTALLATALAAALSMGLSTAEAKTFRWAASWDVLSMDPHALNSTSSMAFLNNVYEALVRFDNGMKIEPALAESWQQLDPTTWRFKLRQGVKFHDGHPFTADDVVFSWARANTPGGLVMSVIGDIQDIRKVDDYSVDVITREPFPILLRVLSYLYVMDKEWSEANGATASSDLKANRENFANRNANGTGPFKLKLREIDTRTVLEVNPDWWDKRTHNVDEVVFTPIKSDATRTSSLLSGAIDAMVSVPLQDLQRLGGDPNVVIYQGPELRTIYIGMDVARDELLYSNVKGKNPLKDARVRQAIYAAIDAEAIKRAVMRGKSWPTGIILSPYLSGFPEGLEARLPTDPAAAKKLLAEAGYAGGFSIGLACPNDRYVYDEAICLAVTSMLAKIGIKVEPQIEPGTKWLQRLNTQDVSLFLMGHAALPTADVYSTLVEALSAGGGLNAGRWSDPAYEALLPQIKRETDETKRKALIKQAMTIVREQTPVIPLHQQPVTWAARKGVQLEQNPANLLRVWHVNLP